MSLSTYEKEMLALVLAVTKWAHYLVGRHFIVRTDHKSLKFFLEQRLNTPSQHTWLTKLLGYDFEICYKQGKEKMAVDALSRIQNLQLLSISAIPHENELMSMIQESWKADPKLQQLIQEMEAEPHSHLPYPWYQQ